ncbi:MAG: hypothetical protein ACYTBZ_02020 [Planctomycetota bacterium]|jgi:hypothetical protein
MLALAESLTCKELGFPIIHDITNLLRIGDITFVSKDKKPQTIEVKTHVLKHYKDKTHASINMSGIFEDKFIDFLTSKSNDDKNLNSLQMPGTSQIVRPNKRMVRQIKRMKTAHKKQRRKAGERYTDNKKTTIIHNIPSDKSTSHWDIANRLVTTAKNSGYATEVVDDAIMYAAIYCDQPLFYPWKNNFNLQLLDKLPNDLVNSGIFYEDKKYLNSLMFSLSWRQLTNKEPCYLRPIFLHPFKSDIIIDLIYCRMLIVTLVNLGKFVESICKMGYSARLPKDDKESSSRFIPVSIENYEHGNATYRIELMNLIYHGQQVLHEYLSLSTFTTIVSEMAKVAIKQIPPIK